MERRDAKTRCPSMLREGDFRIIDVGERVVAEREIIALFRRRYVYKE